MTVKLIHSSDVTNS